MEKTPFLNFFYARRRPPHPPARPIYPAGGDPSPQRTRTACTAQVARQTTSCTGTHARTLDTLHREIGTAAGAGLSAQCVRQTTLFRMQNIFHANVYKCCLCNLTFPWIHVLDNQNTETWKHGNKINHNTVTKQEDKNHETRIQNQKHRIRNGALSVY